MCIWKEPAFVGCRLLLIIESTDEVMVVRERPIQCAAVTHAAQPLRLLSWPSSPPRWTFLLTASSCVRSLLGLKLILTSYPGQRWACCCCCALPCRKQRFQVHHLWFQDFGLDVDAFARMVGDCPAALFNLAVICCNVRKLGCVLSYRRPGSPTRWWLRFCSDECREATLVFWHRLGARGH